MIEGLLTAIVILLVEIALKNRGGTIIERIERKVEKVARRKGAIIMPKEEIAESIATKIKKADKEGKDIKIEEL